MTFTIETICSEKDYSYICTKVQQAVHTQSGLYDARIAGTTFLLDNIGTPALEQLCTSSLFLSEQYPDVTKTWENNSGTLAKTAETELALMSIKALEKRCILNGVIHPCVNHKLFIPMRHTAVTRHGLSAVTHRELMDAAMECFFPIYTEIRTIVSVLQEKEKELGRQVVFGSFYKDEAGENETAKHVRSLITRLASGEMVEAIHNSRLRITRAVNTLLEHLPDYRVKSIQYGRLLGKLDEIATIARTRQSSCTRLSEGETAAEVVRSTIYRHHYDAHPAFKVIRRDLSTMVIDSIRVGMAELMFDDVKQKLVNPESVSKNVEDIPVSQIQSEETDEDDVPAHLIERALFGHQANEDDIKEETDTFHLPQDAHIPTVFQTPIHKPHIRIKKKRTPVK